MSQKFQSSKRARVSSRASSRYASRHSSSHKRKWSSRNYTTSCHPYLSSSARPSLDPKILETIFSKLRWEVSTPINEGYIPSTNHPQAISLGTPVCNDSLYLLLPIASRSDASLSVYFMERVRKTKKGNITIGDIMYTIYAFYNKKSVIAEDLTYVSLTNPLTASDLLKSYYNNPAVIHHLRFSDFLHGHTRFSGLRHQNDNIYSVVLT